MATAAINIVNQRAGAMVAMIMGGVLVGWIAGELVFVTQTMVMTWIILGNGIALIALSAPYAVPQLMVCVGRGRRAAAA